MTVGPTPDLTWTGSQFLDPSEHAAEILASLGTIDLTTKDETWCDGVASACERYYGLPSGTVRVAAGATQLIEVVLRARYRGLIVDVVPGFHLCATLSAQEGWQRVAVGVREQAELLPALAPYLDRPDTAFSLCSPRNPLGYQFPVADIATLLARTNGTVLLDEVYAEFAGDSALSLVGEHPNLFVVRSFSKAWGLANLRVGFVASASLDDGVVLPLLPNAVSGVAQQAVRHLLAHPDRVLRSIAETRAWRELLRTALDRIPGVRVWPSDANYLCLETPKAMELTARLADAGYQVRLLSELRGYPADYPSGIRISVPPQPHLDAIVAMTASVHAPAAVR